MKLKSLDTLWKEYSNQVYPEGMTLDQATQLRQSFMAGFLTGFMIVTELGDKKISKEKAVKVMIYYNNQVDIEAKRYTSNKKEN